MIDITKLFIEASDKVGIYKRKPLKQTLVLLVVINNLYELGYKLNKDLKIVLGRYGDIECLVLKEPDNPNSIAYCLNGHFATQHERKVFDEYKTLIDLSFFDDTRCAEFMNRATELLGKNPRDLFRTKTVLKHTV